MSAGSTKRSTKASPIPRTRIRGSRPATTLIVMSDVRDEPLAIGLDLRLSEDGGKVNLSQMG